MLSGSASVVGRAMDTRAAALLYECCGRRRDGLVRDAWNFDGRRFLPTGWLVRSVYCSMRMIDGGSMAFLPLLILSSMYGGKARVVFCSCLWMMGPRRNMAISPCRLLFPPRVIVGVGSGCRWQVGYLGSSDQALS